ncbi:hypothetical protein PTKIN_Ptkin04bG0115400 [Pterospermum kingtungense]
MKKKVKRERKGVEAMLCGEDCDDMRVIPQWHLQLVSTPNVSYNVSLTLDHHWNHLFLIYIFHTTSSPLNHNKNGRELPPGPHGLPIISNLHMLGKLPHQNLHRLAKRYGPIMSMRLGNIPTIVVSSPETVELILKTHDIVFASRPKLQGSEYLLHGKKGVAFTDYGSYWRTVRKWCTLHLLSSSKVEYFAPLRKAELGSLFESIKKAAASSETVDLSRMVGELSLEISCKIVFGRSEDDRYNLKHLIDDTMQLMGTFNPSDLAPCLAALDLRLYISCLFPYL